jgi:hypothetical protein
MGMVSPFFVYLSISSSKSAKENMHTTKDPPTPQQQKTTSNNKFQEQ